MNLRSHNIRRPLCLKALEKLGPRVFLLLFWLPHYFIGFSHPNTQQRKRTISLEKNCKYFLYVSTQGILYVSMQDMEGTSACKQLYAQGTLSREHVSNRLSHPDLMKLVNCQCNI